MFLTQSSAGLPCVRWSHHVNVRINRATQDDQRAKEKRQAMQTDMVIERGLSTISGASSSTGQVMPDIAATSACQAMGLPPPPPQFSKRVLRIHIADHAEPPVAPTSAAQPPTRRAQSRTEPAPTPAELDELYAPAGQSLLLGTSFACKGGAQRASISASSQAAPPLWSAKLARPICSNTSNAGMASNRPQHNSKRLANVLVVDHRAHMGSRRGAGNPTAAAAAASDFIGLWEVEDQSPAPRRKDTNHVCSRDSLIDGPFSEK